MALDDVIRPVPGQVRQYVLHAAPVVMSVAINEGKLARTLSLERGSGFVSDSRHPGILLEYECESRLEVLCPIVTVREHKERRGGER